MLAWAALARQATCGTGPVLPTDQPRNASRLQYYDLFGGERRDTFVTLSVPASDSLEQEILQVRFLSSGANLTDHTVPWSTPHRVHTVAAATLTTCFEFAACVPLAVMSEKLKLLLGYVAQGSPCGLA